MPAHVFSRLTGWLIGVRRSTVQLGATLFFNSFLLAPWLKAVPCPGFNCYACPAAIMACPIGSLQHFIILRQFPFYLVGFIGIIGALIGRMGCGWICPFGFIQDLLYKARLPKWRISNRLAPARYIILVLLVGLIPFLTLEPWFCKLCPAGGLEAGLPLVLFEPQIRALTGWFFILKMILLGLFLAWFAVTSRPFCRFICPLGSLYAPLNAVSAVQLHYEPALCRDCQACESICPTGLDPRRELDSQGCIRCLECLKACPHGALTTTPASGPRGRPCRDCESISHG